MDPTLEQNLIVIIHKYIELF